MSFFNHRVSFKKVDPLGNGLREEIAAEQTEPEAITLEESVDESKLSQFWRSVEDDIEQDPEWFHFTEGDE